MAFLTGTGDREIKVFMEVGPGFPLPMHSGRTNACVNRLLGATILKETFTPYLFQY